MPSNITKVREEQITRAFFWVTWKDAKGKDETHLCESLQDAGSVLVALTKAGFYPARISATITEK